MDLVIVESPTKAKTIQRFLGANFAVRSSFGHVRDLPRSKLGVDVENNFEPKYVVPITARKRLQELKKILPKTTKVILATDEDREGEAIAWHLIQALGLPSTDHGLPPKKTVDSSPSTVVVQRIVFHEITKNAIAEALKNPRQIDMNLVDAQQARRVLDRLVGYELSPFLWRKVAKGLSAGRVQSVAVRLIAEREREIQNFKPEEYWSVEAQLKKTADRGPRTGADEKTEDDKNIPDAFTATLIKKNGELIGKLGIKSKGGADDILKDLQGADYQVDSIINKDANRYPAPPFATSTLQQEATNKLKFSAKQTMQIAQQLYEGVELGAEGSAGLITYMRTDSLNIAAEALAQINGYIKEKIGVNYGLPVARIYKTKSKGAQEAHEAIRPTDIWREPEKIKNYLTPQQFKLYNLIWKRALASQMAPAVLSILTVDIAATPPQPPPSPRLPHSPLSPLFMSPQFLFRAIGTQIKFDGFLRLYSGKINEVTLPPLVKKENLALVKLDALQHFTQPPARFSEAALIKALEENGIGRPSTYAPTISTIQDRNYVQKDQNRKLFPTEIGFTVNDLLVAHFPKIVDLQFTAAMEEKLDAIAEGQTEWVPVIRKFYEPFKENLTKKYDEVAKQKPEPELTDKICPKCGALLLIRSSRFGKFFACSKFPECRHTENLKSALNIPCPKCVEGDIAEKRTRRGKIFYGCSRYPLCDFALWDKPTGAKCPHCGALMIENKKGEKCSNKECAGNGTKM